MLRKEILHQQDHRSQEACIRQVVFNCSSTAPPNALPLNVNSDVVILWKEFRETCCILPAATGKFNGYWIFVFEEILIPVAFDRVIILFSGLNHIGLSFYFFKTFELSFHKLSISATTKVLPPI